MSYVDHRDTTEEIIMLRPGADVGASLGGMFAALGALAFLAALIAAGANELDFQLNLIDTEGELLEASVIGTLVALGVVFVAFLFGGWVAGRMTVAGDGSMSGMGAGLWILVLAGLFALLGALFGPELNAFARAGLPDWFSSIRAETRTTAGLVLLALFAVTVLLGGYLGGRMGGAYEVRSVTRRTLIRES